MTTGSIISNASPLIALEQIGQLNLLEHLFSTIWIPPAVAREVAPSVKLPKWISERDLAQPIGPRILSASLGPGESEALSLAIEVNADWVILDERPARRLAEALGIPVIGTLGILLAAKRRGFLVAIRPQLEALLDHDFHVAPDLRERVLMDADEAE
jgi:predicted nucleic acid-binding protein